MPANNRPWIAALAFSQSATSANCTKACKQMLQPVRPVSLSGGSNSHQQQKHKSPHLSKIALAKHRCGRGWIRRPGNNDFDDLAIPTAFLLEVLNHLRMYNLLRTLRIE